MRAQHIYSMLNVSCLGNMSPMVPLTPPSDALLELNTYASHPQSHTEIFMTISRIIYFTGTSLASLVCYP